MSTTADDIRALVAQGEGPTVEFKREIPRQADDLTTELVAFANTRGGTVILGVDDDAQLVGLTGDPQRVEERVMGLCRVCDPPLAVTIEVVELKGYLLLIIRVPEGSDKPYRARGRCYVRAGSTTQRASREEERRLFQESAQVLYERTPLEEADYEDLDEGKLRRYFEKRAPGATVNAGRTLRELVEQADLPFLVRRGDRLVPTVAALLLFGSRPTYHLPQVIVSAARFPGLEVDVMAIDRASFRGTVDELIEQGVAFVVRNMRTASILSEPDFPRRTDIPEYPLRAVREVITNAMMHRDYSLAGQTVTLAMFDDRLEVFSPGGLVRGMRLEDLGTGKHLARNPTLAEAMRQLEWAERFGTGIRLIRREMEALGSAKPLFATGADSFTVTLYARKLDLWRNEGRRRYKWRPTD
ncbi:MAG: ATP-binding protein [Chloroflexota bacterium]|nr:ATP-binding protein [Chloroflexota bacterium]